MKKSIFILTMMVMFLSSSLTAFASGDLGLKDKAYKANVKLEGGSGRATIESPTTVLVSNGEGTLHITWSSPNYDYMIVDGEKYLPVNKEGNSEFDIPLLKVNVPFTVVADTVAMSKPHEIEYTLTVSIINSALSTFLISGGIGLIIAAIIWIIIKKRVK